MHVPKTSSRSSGPGDVLFAVGYMNPSWLPRDLAPGQGSEDLGLVPGLWDRRGGLD